MSTRPMNKYQLRKAEEERRQKESDRTMGLMIGFFVIAAVICFCGAGHSLLRGNIYGAIVYPAAGLVCLFYACGMMLAWGGI